MSDFGWFFFLCEDGDGGGGIMAGGMASDSFHEWGHVVTILIAVVGSLGARYWKLLVQWVDGIRGRDWPEVPAVIDIVCVVPQMVDGRHGGQVVGYLGVLTYFYRNPELETGDFSRRFDSEAQARGWAEGFKGRKVMVRVNPRDGSRSTLPKEELEAPVDSVLRRKR